jgi:hypothetical protein
VVGEVVVGKDGRTAIVAAEIKSIHKKSRYTVEYKKNA